MRLALLAEAEAELEDAAAWYDDRSEGLGEEFLSVAREAAHLIAESAEDVANVAGTSRPHSADPAVSAEFGANHPDLWAHRVDVAPGSG